MRPCGSCLRTIIRGTDPTDIAERADATRRRPGPRARGGAGHGAGAGAGAGAGTGAGATPEPEPQPEPQPETRDEPAPVAESPEAGNDELDALFAALRGGGDRAADPKCRSRRVTAGPVPGRHRSR